MRIAVIDGQGGGIGRSIVENLKKRFADSIEIIALGTNTVATSVMLKAGAHEGATGENAIVYNSNRVDIIVGPLGIISANSMLGELTPYMAKAVSESAARKVLVPVNKCNINVSGLKNEALPYYIEDTINIIDEIINK